jgi:hypothetical protein
MNHQESLLLQTKNTYDWSEKLIQSVPYSTWNQMPQVLDTHLSWQVGHLISSIYFHTIMQLKGHDAETMGQIPLREYSMYFGYNEEPRRSIHKYSPEELWENLVFVQKKSLETISGLSKEDLTSPVERARVHNPVAKTKSEVIAWNIQHCWWHYGQIGIIKRVIDRRFDFGVLE